MTCKIVCRKKGYLSWFDACLVTSSSSYIDDIKRTRKLALIIGAMPQWFCIKLFMFIKSEKLFLYLQTYYYYY